MVEMRSAMEFYISENCTNGKKVWKNIHQTVRKYLRGRVAEVLNFLSYFLT